MQNTQDIKLNKDRYRDKIKELKEGRIRRK